MSPVSGWMSGVGETGSRLVAVLGVLVILLVGGHCDRKVGVDANPGPVSLADLVDWWRLDRDGLPPDLDHDDVERLEAIFDEGRASWDAWMETRWRPFLESIRADERDEDTDPDLEKARRRRASAADGLRAEAIALDDRTVQRIEEEGGLPPETAARFGRWYRLERARRLAAGFATGGGSPASPEAIVASASLDDRQRRAVMGVLDRTAVARQVTIDRYAATRRWTAELSGRAASWTTDEDGEDEERIAAGDLAIRTEFRAASRAASLGAALALVDAATVVGDEIVARRWRSMAARLILADLESPARHQGLAAATRRLAQMEGGDTAAIDRASLAYLDGIRSIEDSLSRMLVTATTAEIDAATIELDPYFERHAALPCPVLDPDSLRCELYACRPVACRNNRARRGSRSASAGPRCRMAGGGEGRRTPDRHARCDLQGAASSRRVAIALVRPIDGRGIVGGRRRTRARVGRAGDLR